MTSRTQTGSRFYLEQPQGRCYPEIPYKNMERWNVFVQLIRKCLLLLRRVLEQN